MSGDIRRMSLYPLLYYLNIQNNEIFTLYGFNSIIYPIQPHVFFISEAQSLFFSIKMLTLAGVKKISS